MKKISKRIIACIAFCVIVLLLMGQANSVLISKSLNRYYMLAQALDETDSTYDVQVFGACHSYTSFNAKYFEDTYGLTAFDMGNPGEIIPTTYLNMAERFKKDTPKVALVEIWGINAYETYISREKVFEYYMPVNVEHLPFSLKKAEVIRDFYSLDMLLENFAAAKYKDRIMNMELRAYDFDYSFDEIMEATSNYNRKEMTRRMENNGFCEMPMSGELYTPYKDVSDYHELQAVVAENETMKPEAVMLKYVDKIIDLCEKNGVELIFYRAPYVSCENELKKANWLAAYCEEKAIPFYDLEKEIAFDITSDFLDHQHLNKYGAKKATDYLAAQVLEKAASK